MIQQILIVFAVALVLFLLIWAFRYLSSQIPGAGPERGIIMAAAIVLVVLIFVLWLIKYLGLPI